MEFHTLKVSEVVRETEDAVRVSFDVPSELQETFQYLPGQYVTLKKTLEGEELRRSYSLCTAPEEGKWSVGIKEVYQGRFSGYANRVLQVGDALEVAVPEGRFCLDPKEARGKSYCLIAAGSGVTPILSLLKSILSADPQNQVTLLYGNKKTSSIMFREELEGLKNTYADRLAMYHILSQEEVETDLFKGRITAEKCEAFGQSLLNYSAFESFFLCGPEAMILDVKSFLEGQGIAADKIRFELFATAAKPAGSATTATPTPDAGAEGGVSVQVKLDGDVHTFQLKNTDENLLDAAIAEGVDAPFSCKGGVCCACRAKLVSGTAEMEVNYALDDSEVEEGFILTCQAHATSAAVEIDYDEK